MRVTAVITTHARPHFVHEALASVCAETYEDVECVVVDDGGTFEPRVFSSRIPIRVVRGHALGVASARNLGLAAARGESVIFLDDDDIALPNRISMLVDAARRFGADLCYGLTRRAVAGASCQPPPVPTGLWPPGAVGFREILACAPHINSVLVRTSVLRSVGGFDVDAPHFDDWSAWLQLADQAVRMCSVNHVVAEWRIHEQGLTGKLAQARAMKARLLVLFDRMQKQLSADGARAVADARHVVAESEILTYDDYVEAMIAARAAGGAVMPRFGKRRSRRPAGSLAALQVD